MEAEHFTDLSPSLTLLLRGTNTSSALEVSFPDVLGLGKGRTRCHRASNVIINSKVHQVDLADSRQLTGPGGVVTRTSKTRAHQRPGHPCLLLN